MSKHHSTISRRDFMKGLGLAGAGLGAAAATLPVFHDLDELATSGKATADEYPWYVKKKEFNNPSFEVDWNLFQPWDGVGEGAYVNTNTERNPEYYGERFHELIRAWKKERFPDWDPGAHNRGGPREDALYYAMHEHTWARYIPPAGLNIAPNAQYAGGALPMSALNGLSSPTDSGYLPPGNPKWQDTPENNMLMMRAAIRFYGAGDIGCVDLTDEKMRRIFYKRKQPMHMTYSPYAQRGYNFVPAVPDHPVPYVWEDVDKGYYNDQKFVIPTKCKWMMEYTMVQPTDYTMRSCGIDLGAGHSVYQNFWWVSNRIQRFVQGLGYQSMYQIIGWGPGGAWSCFDGRGENGRAGPYIHWKYGTAIRGCERQITDLPLAPTPPIDMGIFKFCRTCRICRDACVTGAAHQADEPAWEGVWPQENMNGALRWYTDWRGCNNDCGQCLGWCPWLVLGKDRASLIHNVVRNVVAKTGLFNSFFADMSDKLGYGGMLSDDFWTRPGHMYGWEPGI